jgi:hypothetical protein
VEIDVKIGAFNLTANDETERIRVVEIIEVRAHQGSFHPENSLFQHPNYDPSGNGIYDLTMLKLERASNIDDPCVSVIELPPRTHDFSHSLLCWIIGWGATGNPKVTPKSY